MKIKTTALMVLLSANLYASDDWLTNIEEAQEQAKNEKKLVLLEFTGSDWCPPCKALKKNVFDTDQFKAYAKENLVLVELDFPRNKIKITKEQSAYNHAQAKKFAVKGYPTVILLDGDGKRITKKVGFSGSTSVESYIEILKDALHKGQTDGKPDGKRDGKSDGKRDGKPDGKRDGKPDGKRDGKPDGKRDGKPDGKRDGKPDGKRDGKPDGKRDGKPDGKRDGKPDGKRDGKPDGERSGKTDGPPNKVDGKDGKKPNRTGIRKPGSNSGKKPQNGKKPSGEQGRKPNGDNNGSTDDGSERGRLNWKELLGLTAEQAKKFHAIMKKFREELEKIDADKQLDPASKMKSRESARKRRNAKLAEILTEEQMKKFRKIWRTNARPSDGEGGDNEVFDTVTRQQKSQMAKLMRWFSTQVRQIIKLKLSEEDKNKKIAKLKNIYRQKRSEILSPEQASAWAKKDGISASSNRDIGGGDSTGGPDSGKRDGKPDGKRDGKPDGKRDGKPDGKRDGKPDGKRDGKPDGKRDGKPDGKRDGKPDDSGSN